MLQAMKGSEAVELQVYVEAGCAPCKRAMQLAEEVEQDYAGLSVRVIDVATSASPPDNVFAVPTFLINGKVFSLGNPPLGDLRQEIETLLGGQIR